MFCPQIVQVDLCWNISSFSSREKLCLRPFVLKPDRTLSSRSNQVSNAYPILSLSPVLFVTESTQLGYVASTSRYSSSTASAARVIWLASYFVKETAITWKMAALGRRAHSPWPRLSCCRRRNPFFPKTVSDALMDLRNACSNSFNFSSFASQYTSKNSFRNRFNPRVAFQ